MSATASSPSVKSATADLAETARGAADSMRGTGENLKKQGQEAISHASAAASEMGDTASKQLVTFASEVTKMTRDNPIGALAGATIVGVLIGLMLRGRANS